VKGGGLIKEDLSKKWLLCFGAMGLSYFKSGKHESQGKSKNLGHHFQ
jgi:hypothetical protein